MLPTFSIFIYSIKHDIQRFVRNIQHSEEQYTLSNILSGSPVSDVRRVAVKELNSSKLCMVYIVYFMNNLRFQTNMFYCT